MINKIVFLIIFVFTYSSVFGSPSSSGYVITKDNTDTTVNLRDREDLHSKVLAKIPNDTPMSCSFDNSNNPDFCFVKFDESNSVNMGYIHKSRLLFLDEDKSFNKVHLIKDDLNSATYKNNRVTINIKLVSSKLNEKDFSWSTNNEVATLMYQDLKVYGTDNQIVNSVFLYSSIDIKKNGEKYTIPLAKFRNLFIPPYFIENRLVFNNISIYHNPNDDLLYIFSTQADGAAIYTVAFKLKNSLLEQTNIWSENY